MIRTDFSNFKYLTVADVDKLWGLFVTGSGTADLPPHVHYPPTKHPDRYMFSWQNGRILPEFQIVYITRGTGVFESEACGRRRIEEGTVLFLLPGVWHRYMPDPETGWKEHWVSFDGRQPMQFLRHGILAPEKAVLDIGLDEGIIDMYQRILEQIEGEKIGFKEIVSALTYQILAQIHATEKSKRFQGKEAESLVQKAKAFMTDRIGSAVRFEEMAYELGVGYSRFRRLFRHYTGLAPAQYFLQLKLNKARDLLTSTSLTAKEIALLTGFESQFYFSKFFKKRTGLSPIRFREYSRGGGKKFMVHGS
jgi:AraC-like DNA-binding protein